ncbi:MAG: sulfurtransferase TusA family protein [Methanomicrobiales archaeon]|nr:sulfurtransferase TusA family protein [Methanomicrobiales archaeon]
MTTRRLDITGPVSPYCILAVQKKAKALLPSDELIITCTSTPAATTYIPRIAQEHSLAIRSRKPAKGLWEITLTRAGTKNPAGPDP